MFYHATLPSSVEQIKKVGLRPRNGMLFLANNKEDAMHAASQWHQGPFWGIFEVHLDGMAFDGIESDGPYNAKVVTQQVIPPQNLVYLGIHKWEY